MLDKMGRNDHGAEFWQYNLGSCIILESEKFFVEDLLLTSRKRTLTLMTEKPAIERDPRYSPDNLIWIDIEMTGLQPEVNRILEVAAIITDKDLNIIHEGPVVAVHQTDFILDHMDEWNTTTHGNSGLIKRCRESTISEAEASDIFIETFKRFVPEGKSPICGNTIGQDRRFLARWMPRMEKYFHYRYVDVSTIKEMVRRWKPELLTQMKKSTMHQALSDIQDSIDEMKFYREHVMKI